MSQSPTLTPSRLESAHLGDIVCLPDGRRLTVRSRVKLPMPVGSMAIFMVVGEMEALVSLAPDPAGDVGLYHPVRLTAEMARRTQVIFEGVANYWSPHLPATRQAMGEVGFKVADVAGANDPLVVVYRSGEPIAFVRSSSVPAGSLGVMHMPRDNEDTSHVARVTATTTSADRVVAPAAPVQQPERVGARWRR